MSELARTTDDGGVSAPGASREPARRLPTRGPLLAFVGAAIAVAAVALHFGRGTTFHFDELVFLTNRFGFGPHNLLSPYNGQLSAVPIALFTGLVTVLGTDHYWVLRLLLVALHLTSASLVAIVLRPRVGLRPALVLAAFVLLLGRSGDNLIWPAQFGYQLAIIGGLVAYAGTQRRDRPGSWLVLVGLLLALASSSNALPLCVVVGAAVALDRRQRHRWPAVVIPFVLYGVWLAVAGAPQVTSGLWHIVPAWGAKMVATAAGATFGLSPGAGEVVAVLLAAGLVATVAVRRTMSPPLLGALGGIALLWVVTPLTRGLLQAPTTPRYSYVLCVLIVIGIGELLRSARIPGRLPAPWALGAVASICLAGATVGGLAGLRATRADLVDQVDDVKARFGAYRIAEATVPQSATELFGLIDVQAVLRAEQRHGEIAWSATDLEGAPAKDQTVADQTLVAGGNLATRPTAARCDRSSPVRTLRLAPNSSVVIRTQHDVVAKARRFATAGAGADLPVAAGTATLVTGPDSYPVAPAWVVSLPVDARLCG